MPGRLSRWSGSRRSATPPAASLESTRPDANGVVEFSPFEFLDRFVDLVPLPWKHRHRYHGNFAPNHPLWMAGTALAIGNVGNQRDAATSGHAVGDCCASADQPRSYNTSTVAWAKLIARVGEEFALTCPACRGAIRLISFITQLGPFRNILTHLG